MVQNSLWGANSMQVYYYLDVSFINSGNHGAIDMRLLDVPTRCTLAQVTRSGCMVGFAGSIWDV